jgi:hypothetical protein
MFRGLTKKLWEMITSCWDDEPTGRPTADGVLEALRVAAEQWEPEGGGTTHSTHDDPGTASSEEESDERASGHRIEQAGDPNRTKFEAHLETHLPAKSEASTNGGPSQIRSQHPPRTHQSTRE